MVKFQPPLKPRNFYEDKLIYGNKPSSIFNTIKFGKSYDNTPAMPSFKEALKDEEIKKVLSYIWSLIPSKHKMPEAESQFKNEIKN